MKWLQASVSTTTIASDAISEVLMRYGAKGTQILDRADVPDEDIEHGYGALFGPELKEGMPEEVQVTAWFSCHEDLVQAQTAVLQLADLLRIDSGSLSVSVTQVQDEDWSGNWKKYYKPIRVGKRLVIQPVWESYQPVSDDLVILMEPGMAFGTGTHETTRLCMTMLEEHYKYGKALDIGTGSGILAIALAKLGSPEVLAVDIDPVAVRIAQNNVALNNVSAQVTVKTGDLAKDVFGTFHFITANILADVVIKLVNPLHSLLSKDGFFLASGIIKEREQDVIVAFSNAGFHLLHRQEEGEWVALLFGATHA